MRTSSRSFLTVYRISSIICSRSDVLTDGVNFFEDYPEVLLSGNLLTKFIESFHDSCRVAPTSVLPVEPAL